MLIRIQALRLLLPEVSLSSLMSSPYTPYIVNKVCELLVQVKIQGNACNACHLVDLNARNEETSPLCWAFSYTWSLKLTIIIFIILLKFLFHNEQLK